MFGIIYKTTNLINGKIYIGQHTSGDRNYLGSGVLITKSIKKYGRKNFKRNTLIECNSQLELNLYEELFIELYSATDIKFGYNILPGASVGEEYTNPSTLPEVAAKISSSLKSFHNSEAGEIFRKDVSDRQQGEKHHLYGSTKSEDSKKKISKSLTEFYKTPEGVATAKQISLSTSGDKNYFYEKEHTEETKLKISEARKELFKTEVGDQLRKDSSEKMKEFWKTEKGLAVRKESSERNKSRVISSESILKQSQSLKEFYKTEEGLATSKKVRESRKEFYKTEAGRAVLEKQGRRLKEFYQTEEGKNLRERQGEERKVFNKTQEGKLSLKKLSTSQKEFYKTEAGLLRKEKASTFHKNRVQSGLEIAYRMVSFKLRTTAYNIVYCKGTEQEHTFYTTQEAMEYFDMTKCELAKLIAVNHDFTFVKVRETINGVMVGFSDRKLKSQNIEKYNKHKLLV